MSYSSEKPHHHFIQLSVWTARRLTELLDGVITYSDARSNSDELKTIYSKLQEAVWSAEWLRENVVLDMTYDQGLTLFQALGAATADSGPRSDDEQIVTEFLHQWQDLPPDSSRIGQQLAAAPRGHALRVEGMSSLAYRRCGTT